MLTTSPNYLPLRSRIARPIRLAAAAVLVLATAAQADYIEPGQVSVQTEKYQPATTEFAAGTYHYEVEWQGIPVAKAQVHVDEEVRGQDPFWHVEAKAQTGSFLDLFYKLRFTSESLFSAESLRPVRFVSDQKVNSDRRRREVRFEEDGTIRADYIRDGKNKELIQFTSENFTLDPISAAFVARSVPLQLGAKRSFDVFNGKHRYLITFSVESREPLVLEGRKYDTFKVVPEVQKLTDTEGEKRLKHAALWITADDTREVLMLESKVLIGSVSAKLVRFTPKATGSTLAFARPRRHTR